MYGCDYNNCLSSTAEQPTRSQRLMTANPKLNLACTATTPNQVTAAVRARALPKRPWVVQVTK